MIIRGFSHELVILIILFSILGIIGRYVLNKNVYLAIDTIIENELKSKTLDPSVAEE